MSYTFDKARLAELKAFLMEMNQRALTDWHNQPYTAPDKALEKTVMYFAPLMCAPSDRREVAKYIIGSTQPDLRDSIPNQALNIFMTFLYGPSEIYHTITGHPDPEHAWVDFECLMHDDGSYLQELKENIVYTKSHGLKLWTTTELHTSIQTEARNYCRRKHGDAERPAGPTDLLEWMASWIKDGSLDRILEAKTLKGAYEAITKIRGIGPYYAGNPVMMLSALPGSSYRHTEAFCAPGGGALKTIEYLTGKKLGFDKAVACIAQLAEDQETLLPGLTVPEEFRNFHLPNGRWLFAEDQLRYTCNSFEVGMCQFSVYLKLKEEDEPAKRRPNPSMPNMHPLAERLAGRPLAPGKPAKKVAEEAPKTNTSLLEF